jgi:hypothetical protein
MKPTTMRYFDAIHALLGAIEQWDSGRGDGIIAQITARAMKAEGQAPTPADLRRGAIHLLARAEPYFLDGEIQQWIMDSMDSFPHDICIGDVLPPSNMGWILFERPIMGTAEQSLGFSGGWEALAWSTVDKWIPNIKSDEETPIVALDYYHRTDDGYLVLGSSQRWHFGDGLREWEAAQPTGGEQRDEAAHRKMMLQHSFIISLFAFMNQPFSTVESRRLPRAHRRSLQREIGLEDPQVKVITLRRTQHAKGHPAVGSKEWACRWFVKGHWRNQYYSRTQKNLPLWIMPYMKGPEDKPLKGSKGIALYHVTR